MSDCFIRPLTVMEKNNEPDAKDAVLNEGMIQLLCFLLSERKKNDESSHRGKPTNKNPSTAGSKVAIETNL